MMDLSINDNYNTVYYICSARLLAIIIITKTFDVTFDRNFYYF